MFEGVANLIAALLLSRRRQLSLDFTLIAGFPVSKGSNQSLNQRHIYGLTHTRKHGEEGRDKKVTFLLGCSVCVVVYLGCWQKKQRLSSFRIYTSTDASWLERTQFRKKKKSIAEVTTLLDESGSATFQEFVVWLLFLLRFLREGKTRYACSSSSVLPWWIDSVWKFLLFFLFFSSTQTNSGRTRNLSLSLISFYPSESPCIVASFLSPFSSNHGLFWWNLKRLSASVGAEWRHPTAAKADLPFWPPVVTLAIWHLRIFRSTRHTLKSRWYNSITTFIARKDEGGDGQNEKAEISCSFVCRMHFDLSYCRVLRNRGLKYEKKKNRKRKERGG